jgi:hypothetical protein
VTGSQASQEQGEGVRLAAAVILMPPRIAIHLGLQRMFERGMLSGSLKGLRPASTVEDDVRYRPSGSRPIPASWL